MKSQKFLCGFLGKCGILLSFVFISSAICGEIKYAGVVKSLYADENSTKVVGRLLPTAQVEVLKEQGSKVLLKVTGYRLEGGEQGLYFVPNRRILNAGFSKNAGLTFSVISKAKDAESNKEWELASVEVWSENSGLENEPDSLFAKANEAFNSSCSICHALHNQKEFNSNQWPSVVKSMKSRAGFDSDMEYLVSQYLQKNAKDMPKK